MPTYISNAKTLEQVAQGISRYLNGNTDSVSVADLHFWKAEHSRSMTSQSSKDLYAVVCKSNRTLTIQEMDQVLLASGFFILESNK